MFRGREMKPMVYGVAEIAQASGERREAVAQWKFRNLLPRPDQELASGPIWFEDTIVPWLRNYDWDVEPLGSWQDRAAMKARAVSPWGDAFILAISWALTSSVYAFSKKLPAAPYASCVRPH